MARSCSPFFPQKRRRGAGPHSRLRPSRLQVGAAGPGFTAEWNAEQKGRSVGQDGKRDELKRLERKIANFVDTIGEGNSSAALLAALKDAEARKAALEVEPAVAEAPAPRLMPNLAELYREKVAALQDALEGEDAAAAREQVRGLIDEARLIPSPADDTSRQTC